MKTLKKLSILALIISFWACQGIDENTDLIPGSEINTPKSEVKQAGGRLGPILTIHVIYDRGLSSAEIHSIRQTYSIALGEALISTCSNGSETWFIGDISYNEFHNIIFQVSSPGNQGETTDTGQGNVTIETDLVVELEDVTFIYNDQCEN